MRIVSQQTILMKYHALFAIFWKSSNILNCRLLQVIGDALRVNSFIASGDIIGSTLLINFVWIISHLRRSWTGSKPYYTLIW